MFKIIDSLREAIAQAVQPTMQLAFSSNIAYSCQHGGCTGSCVPFCTNGCGVNCTSHLK